MTTRFLAISLLVCCGLGFLPASRIIAADPTAPAPDAITLFREGQRAFIEGLPQVAIQKFQTSLAGDLPPDTRRAAVLTTAQAHITTVDGASALALLSREFPRENGDSTLLYLRAQASALLGRWDDALTDYTKAAQAHASVELKRNCLLGRAEALVALNRKPEALEVCKTLANKSQVGGRARLRGAEIALDTGQLKEAASMLIGKQSSASDHPLAIPRELEKEHAYLLGRLRLAQKQTALAEGIFSAGATRPAGLSERLLACNFWGWTQACLEQGKLAEAEDVLESFVGAYPRTTYLKPTLAFLQKLYDRNPQLPNLADLRRWAADATEPSRQAPALLMLAHVEASLGHSEATENAFANFADTFPDHPLRIRAVLDTTSQRLRENHLAEARGSLEQAKTLLSAHPATKNADDLRSEIDILDARLNLAENDSAKAATLFESIAGRSGLANTQIEAAAFNAVLGWLRTSDTDRFAATERAFLERFPQSPLGAELSLEEGLARAARTPQEDRNGRQRAAAALRRFLRDNPTHPRASEARTALAELAFERPHPNLAAAWRELTSSEMRQVDNPGGGPGLGASTPPASSDHESLPENDRAIYLAIWLADTPGPAQDLKKATALAKRFLDAHADSALTPDVRMKLSEIYFRNEDYSDAQTQLELLVEKSPDSPLVESALYLAGLSASRSMSNTGLDNAVVLFEKAAHRDGPFKLPARLRQAEVQKKLGNFQDALTLYKEVLTATASTADLASADLESRCSALAGQGETLFALGAKDPKSYREAAGVFEQLANATPGASFLWRRQALTQKGQALEKNGETTAALVAYNDALNTEPPETGTNEPEWTWFYRAGNYAAGLLEAQSQWAEAIAIYKKLAAADGPLKADYENKLSRRRLEHFIWED